VATIETRNLDFTYPMGNKKALDNVSFTVKESEFVVLCGKSGCGKSTLLRHLKKNMIPYGAVEGTVLYDGKEIRNLDDRLNASEIGFVQQNPDNQLVTDKVWHELSFGLESLGIDNQQIKRRVAEMASFFDIQTWFRKDVTELSGGQKQLLNLASIMAMQPKVLILDEPTSQLDPIAASEFIRTVYKINRELGTTIIISEHRLEELFPMADRIMVMDEGKIIANDTPWNIGNFLSEKEHPMFYGLPAVMKIYSECHTKGVKPYIRDGEEYSPLTIRDGRIWIEDVMEGVEKTEGTINLPGRKEKDKSEKDKNEKFENVISIKDLWFSYSRNTTEVLRGMNLYIRKGEFFSLLGGNGVGKSTTLKLITGILKAQSGKIEVEKRAAMLPQNPQALFTELTVEEELLEALYYEKINDVDKVNRVNEMLGMMEIDHLRKSHPYDLSGGEQQRLALGKILLLNPEILLLDEPTKGLDPFFKISLARIFKKLKEKGVTIFMVSHDIEFCAEYADRCAMFFDGDVVSIGTPKEFFSGNNFYTTTANRIARAWRPDIITWEEVASWVEETTKGLH